MLGALVVAVFVEDVGKLERVRGTFCGSLCRVGGEGGACGGLLLRKSA